jgi:predicted metal-dependent hydrolase
VKIIVTEKKIKNLHMRAKADGIHINVPFGTSRNTINNFFEMHKVKMIAQHLELKNKDEEYKKLSQDSFIFL